MALISQALVTMDEAGIFLQTQTADHDPALEMIINAVSQKFSSFCGRTFLTTTYTSLELNGSGGPRLILPNWPVTNLGDVIEGGVTLVEDTNFLANMDLGILERGYLSGNLFSSGKWTDAIGGVVVTYTAGYADTDSLPWDLKVGVLEEVGRQYRNYLNKIYNETSRSAGGASVAYDANADEAWKKVAAMFRRLRFG